MWAAIKKAINSTIGTYGSKPLNEIVERSAYQSYYNSMLAYVTAYGNNSGAIEVIEDGKTEITGYGGKTSLKFAVLPPTTLTIANSAFASSGLTNITIPPSVTLIGNGAFINTNLTSVKIPRSVHAIGSNAFPNTTRSIYIDKNNGEIPGAPWGATGATVYYNNATVTY